MIARWKADSSYNYPGIGRQTDRQKGYAIHATSGIGTPAQHRQYQCAMAALYRGKYCPSAMMAEAAPEKSHDRILHLTQLATTFATALMVLGRRVESLVVLQQLRCAVGDAVLNRWILGGMEMGTAAWETTCPADRVGP